MKLLTLNTHSLMETNYKTNIEILVNTIISNDIDVIALQEIMQPIKEKIICDSCFDIPLKEGNFAKMVVKMLMEKGYKYYLFWHGFKKSYDKFDEGLAIVSKFDFNKQVVIQLTPFDDYNNWKTRKAIGVKIKNQWFFCVHMGWWDDKEAPFRLQFEKLMSLLPKEEAFLMGDFNSEANERNKGYELVISNGFFDTYNLALSKDDGITAHSQIDGWEKEQNLRKMRIDYIFTNRKQKIVSSHTIFNGENEKIISDHYGIIVTL